MKKAKTKLIPLGVAAKHLGMTSSSLNKLLKREGVATGFVPVMTKTGVKESIGVPPGVVAAIKARREQALRNAASV